MLVGALKAAAAVLLLVVATFSLQGKLPSLTAVGDAIAGADTGWLAVAVVAEFVSMVMFARQQRRLLAAFGVRMPRHRALALSYSRSAIAISLPAGSAISAAYAFRQFRTDGASKRTAATVMVLSGLLSFAALALLYTTGALAAGAVHLGVVWRREPGLASVSVAISIVMIAFVGLFAWQSSWHIHPAHPRAHRPVATRWPRLAVLLRPVTDAITSSRDVDGRHWTLALGAALTNWLTDLLCLYAAARAFGLPVSMWEIGAVYLTVQIVRQVPLTPGGIGVIEVSLLAGLVSAGADNAAAAATVLVYRLLSCWLIIPVGLLCWLVLRRPSHQHPVEDVPEVAGQVGDGVVVAGDVPQQRVLEHAVHQRVRQPGRHREA
ncbi:YbhN family protein [Actinophytocola sp. KF-1]